MTSEPDDLLSNHTDIFSVQRPLLALIAKIFGKGHLAHAYLLTGAGMDTRKTVAMFFAKLLLCPNHQTKDGYLLPCGVCIHCMKVAHGTHPDLFICPSERDGTIKIEHVRMLQKAVSFAPLEADKRICLIFNAENMTIDAANSLLKLLEEPPSHNHLLLTVSSLETILPTILSRCQVLKCLPTPFNLTTFTPEERAILQMYPAGFWERLCANDSEMAKRLLTSRALGIRNNLWQLLIAPSNIPLFFKMIKELSEDQEDIICLKLFLLSVVLDILLVKSNTNAAAMLLNQDMLQEIRAMAGTLPISALENYLEKLEKVEYFLERNINKASLVETLLLFWIQRAG